MLKKSLYLYALMIFSFTAVQGTEDCESEADQGPKFLGCPHFPLYPTDDREASSFYALLEDDDDRELEEMNQKLLLVCDEENRPYHEGTLTILN